MLQGPSGSTDTKISICQCWGMRDLVSSLSSLSAPWQNLELRVCDLRDFFEPLQVPDQAKGTQVGMWAVDLAQRKIWGTIPPFPRRDGHLRNAPGQENPDRFWLEVTPPQKKLSGSWILEERKTLINPPKTHIFWCSQGFLKDKRLRAGPTLVLTTSTVLGNKDDWLRCADILHRWVGA